MQDRALRRERVGGRAGGRRDDEAVGAQRVDEFAVERDLELDQAALRALADHRLVERERAQHRLARRAGCRRRAACAPPACTCRRGSRRCRSACRAWPMSVMKPTRPWFTPTSGTSCAHQVARRGEHRAVAAHHDREIGLAAERRRSRRPRSPSAAAVSCSMSASQPRVSRKAASSRSDAAISGAARACRSVRRGEARSRLGLPAMGAIMAECTMNPMLDKRAQDPAQDLDRALHRRGPAGRLAHPFASTPGSIFRPPPSAT